MLASRYEIRKSLGKGGMGMVYLAHDRELDDMVALKLLRSDAARAPDLARRFRSEIKLARKIRHPNVCAIHEYGQAASRHFIVMEYVEGTNLRQELTLRGRLPAEEAYDVAIQIAEGLEAVHAAGVVHRDLKTSNVMRDSRGRVRLMDFGIAKLSGPGNTTVTATGQVVGTPEYMSPEQCRGEKVDCRSDVYALGVVVFELFTGEVPFRGDTPVATLFKHIQEPPPLDTVAARLPAPLLPVLRKALEKSPETRYGSAREVADALRRARGQSAPPTPPPRLAPVTASDARAVPARTALVAAAPPRATPPAAATVVPAASHPAPASPPDLAAAPGAPAVATARRPPGPAPPGARWAWIGLGLGAAVLSPFLWLAVRSRVAPTAGEGPARAGTPVRPVAITPAPSPVRPVETAEVRRDVAAPGPSILPPPTTVSPARPASRPALPTPAPGPAQERRAREGPALPAAGVAVGNTPPASTPPAAVILGVLRVIVTPWAEVEVDGRSVGVSPPLGPVRLSPGTHVVRLLHPDYAPFRRKVTASPGETVTLRVDLAREAFPK